MVLNMTFHIASTQLPAMFHKSTTASPMHSSSSSSRSTPAPAWPTRFAPATAACPTSSTTGRGPPSTSTSSPPRPSSKQIRLSNADFIVVLCLKLIHSLFEQLKGHFCWPSQVLELVPNRGFIVIEGIYLFSFLIGHVATEFNSIDAFHPHSLFRHIFQRYLPFPLPSGSTRPAPV